MATSTIEKKPCIKCDKGSGIIICYGCQQTFCTKHILNHREDLSIQIDNIGQEHDLLRRDLNREENNKSHPLLTHIDAWELESIVKIQIAAETARVILRQIIDRNKHGLNIEMSKISDELRLSRQSDDYTEKELEKWNEQIKELRRLISEPVNIDLIDDDHTSSTIRLIKIRDNYNKERPKNSSYRLIRESFSFTSERFDQVVGPIVLSEENLVATCSDVCYYHSSVCGRNSYFIGIHQIRFRIENKTINNLFFGIRTHSQQMLPWNLHSSSVYGWRELEWIVLNGEEECTNKNNIIKTADEVTLTLNCDNRLIQFEHHRTNRLAHLAIDLRKCPLPWTFLVEFSNQNDSVRILR